MKEIIIGRGNDCDIVINDDSDIVSRRHTIIRYSFTGAMQICDVSQNGTYLNGERLEKDKFVDLSIDDTVSLAKVHDLNLREIRNPYTSQRIIAAVVAIVLVLVIGCAAYFITRKHGVNAPISPNITDSTATDSTNATKASQEEVKDAKFETHKIEKSHKKKARKGKNKTTKKIDESRKQKEEYTDSKQPEINKIKDADAKKKDANADMTPIMM